MLRILKHIPCPMIFYCICGVVCAICRLESTNIAEIICFFFGAYFPLPDLALMLGLSFSAPLPLLFSPLDFLPAGVRPLCARPLWLFFVIHDRFLSLFIALCEGFTSIVSYHLCLPSSPT